MACRAGERGRMGVDTAQFLNHEPTAGRLPRAEEGHTGEVSPTFIVVPQWQGSVSARAMRLSDGAEAIRGDLPSSATRVVDVPAEAGDSLGTGVHRYSALLAVLERMSTVLGRAAGDGAGAGSKAGGGGADAGSSAGGGGADWALTIGGDCGVSLAAVQHASRRHPDDLAVVWLDAQPDLHTPESSPSGAFTGMVLRAITGEGADGLALEAAEAVPLKRVVLAGTRDIDPGEDELITQRGIPLVEAADLATPDALVRAVSATGARQVYLHIDLDVLDPSEFAGVGNLVPFGVAVEALTSAITALRAEFGLAGATIAGFAPASVDAADDDLPAILRIIGALTK
jgi:arginase